MNCEDAQAHLLAGQTDREVAAHIAGCDACRQVAANLTEGAALLEDEAMWLGPSDELEDSIIEMLVSDGAAGSDEPIPTTDDVLPPQLHAVHDADVMGRSEPSTPNLWALFAVAAVVIAGFLIINASRSNSDWSVEVAAGPAAPAASAVVDGWREDGGTRLVMNARDLEPAPDGFFYEMWLSDGPLHISGGTFTDAGDVELWVAVDRADFPRIWVTLEPIDADESPSAEVVLDTGNDG